MRRRRHTLTARTAATASAKRVHVILLDEANYGGAVLLYMFAIQSGAYLGRRRRAQKSTESSKLS